MVLLYDVLDHCIDPVEALNLVKSISSSDTEIHVRCHCWVSRHGGHLYKQLNKAWAHLFVTQDELDAMGIKTEFVQRYFYPIARQTKWFEAAGLLIKRSDVTKSHVERKFFNRQVLTSRLPNGFKNTLPIPQMEQTFNDYVLKMK